MMHPMPKLCDTTSLDPAVAVLAAAHPEGPPADVWEPEDPLSWVCLRSVVLEKLGDQVAVVDFPKLFPEYCR